MITHGICRVGMGESHFETPGGHTICDCDPYRSDQTPVLIGHEKRLHNLEEFYFYKNHIIGYGKEYYFVFNENTEQTDLFQTEREWKQIVSEKGLKPAIYTNWLDISDSPATFLLIAFLWGMIAAPILLLILIVVMIELIRRRISVSRRFIFRTGSVLLILAFLIGCQINTYSF